MLQEPAINANTDNTHISDIYFATFMHREQLTYNEIYNLNHVIILLSNPLLAKRGTFRRTPHLILLWDMKTSKCMLLVIFIAECFGPL